VFNEVMSADVITDFEVGLDTLSFSADLLNGVAGEDFVDTFATIENGEVSFEFGGGQSVTLQGVNSTFGLQDDLDFF